MRLFVFSLFLALAVILSSVFFFDAGAGLQQHLLWVLSSTIGGVAFLGVVIAFFEGRRDRVRQQKRQSFLNSPSNALRTVTPAPLGPASSSSLSGPSVAFGDSSTSGPVASESVEPDASIPEPVTPKPVTPEPEEELVSATTTPDNGVSTQSATAFPSVPSEEASEEASEEVSSEEGVVESSESKKDRAPADQVLYLVRDFEFSEVKRVLNLWQMSYEDATKGNILGRWVSEDGTLVEVVSDQDGAPCIEIRGPMADELAEFLPQDLPVYPNEPQGSQLI